MPMKMAKFNDFFKIHGDLDSKLGENAENTTENAKMILKMQILERDIAWQEATIAPLENQASKAY